MRFFKKKYNCDNCFDKEGCRRFGEREATHDCQIRERIGMERIGKVKCCCPNCDLNDHYCAIRKEEGEQ